jgi:hypothetical protein
MGGRWGVMAVGWLILAVILSPGLGETRGKLREVRLDDPRIQDLVPILERIKAAVITRDIRPIQELQINWGEDDDLGNVNSPLYCYVFDTVCLGKRTDPRMALRSARNIFLGAKPLRMSIQEYRVLGPPGERPKKRFLVIFYDASKIRPPIGSKQWKRLHVDFVAWTFERLGAEWRSPFGVFDTMGADE